MFSVCYDYYAQRRSLLVMFALVTHYPKISVDFARFHSHTRYTNFISASVHIQIVIKYHTRLHTHTIKTKSNSSQKKRNSDVHGALSNVLQLNKCSTTVKCCATVSRIKAPNRNNSHITNDDDDDDEDNGYENGDDDSDDDGN